MNLLIALRIPTVDGWLQNLYLFSNPRYLILIFIATALCKLITGENGWSNISCNKEESYMYYNCTFFRQKWKFSQKLWNMITQNKDTKLKLERLGESGATHDSQSAPRSGVEAWVARNLNGWDDSDAGLSQAWVRCPSGLLSLHHSRLSTRSSYQLYSFSGDRRFCYDNHGSFVYDSPNLFSGPSGSVRTGLTAVRSEPGHRTHLTSLIGPITQLLEKAILWPQSFFFVTDFKDISQEIIRRPLQTK